MMFATSSALAAGERVKGALVMISETRMRIR
jgi:hypothetical protein